MPLANITPKLDTVNSSGSNTYTNNDLTAEKTSSGNAAAFSIGRTSGSGKWYFEFELENKTGITSASVGITTAESQSLTSGIGVLSSSYALVINPSSAAQKRNANSLSAYGNAPTLANSDIIGVAVDEVNDAIWFSVNGSWIDGDGTDSSATVLSEIEAGTTTSAAYTTIAGTTSPAESFAPAIANTESRIRLRQLSSEWQESAPSGFSELSVPGYALDPEKTKDAYLSLSGTRFETDINNATIATFWTKSSGKWHWETTLETLQTNPLILGIWVGTISSFPSDSSSNFRTNSGFTGMMLGSLDSEIWMEGSSSQTGLAAIANGSVISVEWDADSGEISFFDDGVQIGTTETGITTGNFVAAFQIWQQSGSGYMDVNLGQNAFAMTPSSGFIGPNNEPLLADGNTTIDLTSSGTAKAVNHSDSNTTISLSSSGTARSITHADSNTTISLSSSGTASAVTHANGNSTIDLTSGGAASAVTHADGNTTISLSSSGEATSVIHADGNTTISLSSSGEADVAIHGPLTIQIPFDLSMTGTLDPANHGNLDLSLPFNLSMSGNIDFRPAAQWTFPWSIEIVKNFTFVYGEPDPIAEFIFPLTYNLSPQFVFNYALLEPISIQYSFPYEPSNTVSVQYEYLYDILGLNPSTKQFNFTYDLRDVTFLSISDTVSITVDGLPADIKRESVSLKLSEGSFLWQCQLELASLTDYGKFDIDTPFTVTVSGETYNFLTDSKQLRRSDNRSPIPIVTGLSTTAIYTDPRASRITQSYDTPTMAKTLVENILGVTVTWEIVDWLIPAGRLSVVDATPLDIVKTIAKAAGGVVETNPDGTIVVRHQFPDPVSTWPTAIVDQTYTDQDHRLSVTERQRSFKLVDKFVVRDSFGDIGVLSAQVDNREDGLNNGATQFYPGDNIGFLVYKAEGIKLTELIPSSGTIFQQPDQVLSVEEDLEFFDTNKVSLNLPTVSIDSVNWLGTSLGTLTLDADGITVTSASSGTAIARVTVTRNAKAYHISTPTSVGSLTEFPIITSIKGDFDTGTGVAIITQRGDANSPGPDIIDPLVNTTLVAISRGRAELDRNEIFRDISQTTTFRTGVRLGQLSETMDEIQGETWRGTIKSITHKIRGVQVLTDLRILRK